MVIRVERYTGRLNSERIGKQMILEQLQDYCDCIDDRKIDEQTVNELINTISMYTCWAQEPCETFLMSERREVVEVPVCADMCDVFTFEPFYHPFDPESFTFTLVTQEGITETSESIEDFAYSEIDDVFRVDLGLQNCACQPICGCPPTKKLVVTYDAGYEELPDCLLPIFCEALQYIIEKNTCDCAECQDCESDVTPQEIDYENGGTVTDRLHEFFVSTLSVQYIRELSLISLCDKIRYFGGVV